MTRFLARHLPSARASNKLAIRTLGGDVVTTRLCEVLFVQALRAHIADDLSWTDQGWFRMLADPLLREHLAEAARPEATVSSLANAPWPDSPADARTVHAVRRDQPIRPPAPGPGSPRRELLRAGDTDLTPIAGASGFGSRQALRRAFRRELGVSPAAQ